MNPPDRSVNARRVTRDEIAYRDGYAAGRVEAERQPIGDRYSRQRVRETHGAFNGLILGIALAALVGLVAAVMYSLARSTELNLMKDPEPEAVEPQGTDGNTNGSTTIIERTIERTQESVPAPPEIQVPDVQINIPEPTQSQPSTSQSSEPQSSSGSANRAAEGAE